MKDAVGQGGDSGIYARPEAMSDSTSFRVAVQRPSETSWFAALKLPQNPPWPVRKEVNSLAERSVCGNPRRPHIWPPPLHVTGEDAAAAIATVSPDSLELRRKLEDRAFINVLPPAALALTTRSPPHASHNPPHAMPAHPVTTCPSVPTPLYRQSLPIIPPWGSHATSPPSQLHERTSDTTTYLTRHRTSPNRATSHTGGMAPWCSTTGSLTPPPGRATRTARG